MKVKAIALGFYGDKRRREGQVFDVKDSAFTPVWMEKVTSKSESSKPESDAKPEPKAGAKKKASKKKASAPKPKEEASVI